MAYVTIKWIEVLPFIMLGLRSAINEERGVSAAQMVYGAELRLPRDSFDEEGETITEPKELVRKLQQAL